MNVARLNLVWILLIALCVSACGSGDGGSNDGVDPILVNAGSDITIDENLTVSLFGGSSGGEGDITYSWSAEPTIDIVHEDTSVTNASLIAPTVTQTTLYTISLVASDANNSSTTDSIVLTVLPVNILPVASISVAQIDGYNTNEFPTGAIIDLDASESSDADPQTDDAEITAYLWQQIAGPNLLANIDTSLSTISIVSPSLSENTSAMFRVTVSDQASATSSTDVTITLLSQAQTLPTASATLPRTVFAGELIVLEAEASSDAPDAAPFSALWTSDDSWIITDTLSFETYAQAPLVSEDSSSLISVNIEDSFRNGVSVEIETQIYAPITRLINDTGISQFANASANTSEFQIDFAGQDAQYGADIQFSSNAISKVGDGEAGFDFTRLDNNGDVLDDEDIEFNCVRDNTSGLIWQVKSNTDTSHINYVEQVFTWYDDENNGNVEGSLNADSSACNLESAQCNTQAYIEQINSVGLCSLFDWRLPTPSELQSIIHYGKTAAPMVDEEFFPFWGAGEDETLWYWTSQSSADGVSEDLARNAWAFDMNTGNDGFLDKTSENYLILVRAGR